jgi:hypothetical protein
LFDLRYHVASLAAVFLALIIGILVGVGISSQDVVAKSERDLLREQKADLERRLDRAGQRIADLTRARSSSEEYVEATYPALVDGRLDGKRVALFFVGSVDAGLRSSVEEVLQDAGADTLVRMRALRVPVDTEAVDRVLTARPALAAYAGEARRNELGGALADEFVAGGETPLWNALEKQLVEERLGDSAEPADAVVVVRSAQPQGGGTAKLLGGFYTGLANTALPAVGVETTQAELSVVETLKKRGVSTVDDLDTPPGRLALALLLAGGKNGHYGVKQTAEDGLLPPVVPLQPLPSG